MRRRGNRTVDGGKLITPHHTADKMWKFFARQSRNAWRQAEQTIERIVLPARRQQEINDLKRLFVYCGTWEKTAQRTKLNGTGAAADEDDAVLLADELRSRAETARVPALKEVHPVVVTRRAAVIGVRRPLHCPVTCGKKTNISLSPSRSTRLLNATNLRDLRAGLYVCT